MKKSLLLSLGLLPLVSLTSCGGSSLNSDKPLKDVYSSMFKIGAAINDYNRDSELLSHFNSVTPENALKWGSVHPSLAGYNFEAADEYINIAKSKNIGVRGHALVWHHEQSIPVEVFMENGEPRSKEDILSIETDHIQQVVTHFKDDVYCWDVANEVIDDGTTPINEDGSNIYRQSNWYKYTGRDFILNAFVQADATLKQLGLRDKVKLYYNDYDNTKPVKREKTLAMLNWLISEGAPIDGIGMQCHYHLGSFDMNQLEESIVAYSALGLDVQITEFDVDIYDETLAEITNYPLYSDVPQETLDIQATIYGRAFEIFRRHQDKISSVSFWGVADNNTYMNDNKDYGYRTNYPYIFDVFEGKKAAFYAITDYERSAQ